MNEPQAMTDGRPCEDRLRDAWRERDDENIARRQAEYALEAAREERESIRERYERLLEAVVSVSLWVKDADAADYLRGAIEEGS